MCKNTPRLCIVQLVGPSEAEFAWTLTVTVISKERWEQQDMQATQDYLLPMYESRDISSFWLPAKEWSVGRPQSRQNFVTSSKATKIKISRENFETPGKSGHRIKCESFLFASHQIRIQRYGQWGPHGGWVAFSFAWFLSCHFSFSLVINIFISSSLLERFGSSQNECWRQWWRCQRRVGLPRQQGQWFSFTEFSRHGNFFLLANLAI